MKKIKRNILGAILVVLTAALASCSDTMENVTPAVQETMNVSLTVAIPDYTPVTRTGVTGTEGIGTGDMQLLCFDKDGIFVGLASGVTVGEFTDSDVKTETEAMGENKSLSATVPGTTARIHFVANQSVTANDAATYLGMNENTLMMQLESSNTDKIKYWGYVKKDDAASMKSFLENGNSVVYLLRDRAKVTVQTNSATGVSSVEGVVVYNSYDHGTVAPLDKNTTTFQTTESADSWTSKFNFITLPKENSTVTGTESDLTETAYTFEHANTNTDPLIVIIKVKHSDNSVKYHKILLQDESYQNYTVKRNHEYRIVISQLAAKLGYDSFDAAVNGTASNNQWTKVEDIVPSVSDNTHTLTIDDGTYIVLNSGASGSQSIKFTYSGDSEMSAENFAATFTSNKGVSPDNQATVSYDNGTGTISYSLNTPTSSLATATIELQDKKHGLMRRIHLYSIDAFQFVSPTFPTTMGTNESATATLKLTVPEDYPDELLPVEVRIASPDINPQDCDVEVGSTSDVDGGKGWNCWFVKKIYSKNEEVSITLKNVRGKSNGDTGEYWVKTKYFKIDKGSDNSSVTQAEVSAPQKFEITY